VSVCNPSATTVVSRIAMSPPTISAASSLPVDCVDGDAFACASSIRITVIVDVNVPYLTGVR